MPRVWIVAYLFLCIFHEASASAATISATRQDDKVRIAADHFRLTVDGGRGCQITEISLFDGSAWNRLLGADGRTLPDVKLNDSSSQFSLDRATNAKIENFEANTELVRFETSASPLSPDARKSPWIVRLQYEIHAEGGIFITTEFSLPKGETTLAGAEMSLGIDAAATKFAKYLQKSYTTKNCIVKKVLPSARVAFGVNPERSYTNEVQAIVEDNSPIAGKTAFSEKRGRFTWNLADGQNAVKGPVTYRNRFSLGLGAAAIGRPRTNVVAQRVYHWINWINKKDVPAAEWYPSEEIIDRMAANNATMLILHMHWMSQRGSNGKPHANYLPLDEAALRRTIARAHDKKMHIGLYSRGIEQYAPNNGFFAKYLKRDWDGLYVDWDGPHCTAYHEAAQKPNPALNDVHYSTDGHILPARDYYLYVKKLRNVVGPRGFLIGHLGFGNTGVLANLVKDGYLPGETGDDHGMLLNGADNAVFQGMLGGVLCMPWTVDAEKKYTCPLSVAKMAVWGFYPHACLAFQRPSKNNSKTLLPADPNAQANAYVLPYWRVLAAVDAERCTVYNSPAVNLTAAVSSNPKIPCLIYKQAGDTPADAAYLVIAANLSDAPASAKISLKTDVLGMSGDYRVERIDSATGAAAAVGNSSGDVETSRLEPSQIEGFRLSKAK